MQKTLSKYLEDSLKNMDDGRGKKDLTSRVKNLINMIDKKDEGADFIGKQDSIGLKTGYSQLKDPAGNILKDKFKGPSENAGQNITEIMATFKDAMLLEYTIEDPEARELYKDALKFAISNKMSDEIKMVTFKLPDQNQDFQWNFETYDDWL